MLKRLRDCITLLLDIAENHLIAFLFIRLMFNGFFTSIKDTFKNRYLSSSPYRVAKNVIKLQRVETFGILAFHSWKVHLSQHISRYLYISCS